MPAFHEQLRRFQHRVERALDACLPAAAQAPARLHEAMRYVTLDGGKRVRASLVYAAGQAVGAPDAHERGLRGGGGGVVRAGRGGPCGGADIQAQGEDPRGRGGEGQRR